MNDPTPTDRARLRDARHAAPHDILGAHPATRAGRVGIAVRAFHPDATAITCLVADGDELELGLVEDGLFEGFLPDRTAPLRYRLRLRFPDGNEHERGDPYAFLPTLGELDLHLISEGRHQRLWDVLGARPLEHDGVPGVAFSVWAPSAERVSGVGDFNHWDGRLYPMRSLGPSGVWELFIPDLPRGSLYKFEIRSRGSGELRMKADPLARWMEPPPGTACRVTTLDGYEWNDQAWMAERPGRDLGKEPVLIYEAHLGSWTRDEHNRPLSYREIAPRLVEHLKRFGFTHLELLPVAEHPYTPSWGYQVSGYYAPTARYGEPDDFRYLVDLCHQHGIGVILDWVPAHFPKDDWALARFDGTALYEHEDPRQGEHPDWGTLIFNYARSEVRNFLVANALYWLELFHVDGLRVDAVASMLYLDYSRKEGEWIPNEHGGRENLAAIAFLRELNEEVAAVLPGCFTIAEESTAWGGVTRSPAEGGLGFGFKWNMGWMHDTLQYFSRDPIHRRHHQDQLTFAMIYEYSERFVMPISHDEVVHGKGSLRNKLPGDAWQKLANLRLLLTYQYTRPGKALLFMGVELAPESEWDHARSLEWHLADDPARAGHIRFMEDLGRLYRGHPCLWRGDHDPAGFAWIDCSDRANSIVSYLRQDGDAFLAVVLNLTPVPRTDYRIGVPEPGSYRIELNSHAQRYGGEAPDEPVTLVTLPEHTHGHDQCVSLALPPLGALVLARI